jgi:hypothetical protein
MSVKPEHVNPDEYTSESAASLARDLQDALIRANEEDRSTRGEAIDILVESSSGIFQEIDNKIQEVIASLEETGQEEALKAAHSALALSSTPDIDNLRPARQVAEWIRKAEAFDRLSEVMLEALRQCETAEQDLRREIGRADDAEREAKQLRSRIESIPFLDT